MTTLQQYQLIGSMVVCVHDAHWFHQQQSLKSALQSYKYARFKVLLTLSKPRQM